MNFIVLWGRDLSSPSSRPYSTYVAKDGRTLAFSESNLWFSDCPTVTSLEDLDVILSSDPQQQVIITTDDATRLLGWTDFSTDAS